jgi:opacity protein-like surface antigen
MKRFTLLAALLAYFAGAAQAQDQPHKLEVGVDLLTYTPLRSAYSSFYNEHNNDRLHYLSGVVFRYNIGRFGLRSGVSYTTNTEKTDDNYCNDCLSGKSKGKELRLKVGGQYAPLPSATWLYGFADVFFRRYTSEGHYSGGFTGHQNMMVDVTSNGVGLSAGVGAKVKVSNHFYLNPEVYLDGLRARNSNTTTDVSLAGSSSYRTKTRTEMLAPAVRLNLLNAF